MIIKKLQNKRKQKMVLNELFLIFLAFILFHFFKLIFKITSFFAKKFFELFLYLSSFLSILLIYFVIRNFTVDNQLIFTLYNIFIKLINIF